MIEQRRGPFHGVDLGHERRVDQPRVLEELLVRPLRIDRAQPIANSVLLQCEQGAEHGEPEPEAGNVRRVRGEEWVDLNRGQAGGINPQFAVDPGSRTVVIPCASHSLYT